jgi:hypothetical protein
VTAQHRYPGAVVQLDDRAFVDIQEVRSPIVSRKLQVARDPEGPPARQQHAVALLKELRLARALDGDPART